MSKRQTTFFSHIGYSSGNFGKNLMAGSMDILFLFLATELLGLSPIIAGVILLCSMVLDAVLDPVIGVILDRAKGPLGKPVTLILLGAPLTGLTFALVFHLPVLGLSEPWIVAATLLLFRTAYSIIDLPHNTLLTSAIPSGKERARVATYRFVFSTLAALALALALKPMVQTGDEGSELSQNALAWLSILMGFAATIVIGLSGLSVAKRRVHKALQAPAQSYRLSETIKAISQSSECIRVIGAGALCAFGLPLFSKSLLFVADRVFGDVSSASNLLLALVAGQFIGLAGWIVLAKKVQTAQLLHSAYWLACAALILAGFSNLWGHEAMLAATVLVGIGAAGSYALIWALLSDAVDHLQTRTGVAAGGTIFGIAVLSQKAGIGLSGLVLGLGLHLEGSFVNLSTASVVIIFGTFVPAIALAGAGFFILRPNADSKVAVSAPEAS